jgi:hypothetical protein
MRTETIRTLLSLSIVLLLGGVAYMFFLIRPYAWPDASRGSRISADWRRLTEAGQNKQPTDRQWDYGEAPRESWWHKFDRVNIIGEKPKVAEAPTSQKVAEPVAPPLQPIKEIIAAVNMVLGGDRPEQGGLAVITYQKSANVEVPANSLPMPSVPSMPSMPARDGVPAMPSPVPAGQRPGGPQRPAAMDLQNLDPVHRVAVGERLWKPFAHIKLARVVVDGDGAGAVFVRDDPQGKPHEDLLKVESDTGLVDGKSSGGDKTAASQPEKNKPTQATDWTDPGDLSREVAPGKFHISRKDEGWFADNYDQALGQDLTLQGYSNPRLKDPQTGKPLKGLQLKEVGPSLTRYGIQQGDLLLSVNGVPVTSQAQMMKELKDQYNNGTRSFVGRFLSKGAYVEKSYTVRDGGRR